MDENASYTKYKFLLPFEWKKKLDKNLLYCGPQNVGHYYRLINEKGDNWILRTIFYSKTVSYSPASEQDIRNFILSTCANEIMSMNINIDAYIQNFVNKVVLSVVNKIKYGIRFIRNGTTEQPGEFKKAFKENAGDFKSLEVLTDYDSKLFKKVDAFLETIIHK